jgi:hypothetical protein
MTSMLKYISTNKQSIPDSYDHYDFCCQNKIPYILIHETGKKYWKVSFDIISMRESNNQDKIDCTESLIPLYEYYAKKSHLPKNRIIWSGGSRVLGFTVYKKDAIKIAELICDLIVLLNSLVKK